MTRQDHHTKARPSNDQTPHAVGEGVLRLGSAELPCAMLSTGESVLTGACIETLLGASKDRNSGRQIERIMAATLGKSLRPRIAYAPKGGGRAHAYPASMFVGLCEALVDLKLDGKLHPKQEPALVRARIILAALGRAAIETMVADACGVRSAPGDTEARFNEASERVRVEVIDPAAHHFIAHVGDADLPLHADAPDRKPRVRDVDFARWVGFARPEAIRDLIKRMISTRKLSRDEVFRTVRKTSEGGRPATEFWLTREQALLVATQSETPRAWAITRLMARVFDAVLERMTPVPPSFDPAALVELMGRAIGAALRPVVERIDRLEARVVESERRELPAHAATYGAERACNEITEPLRRWSRAMAATQPDPKTAYRKLLGEAHDGLRARAQFTGYGASWDVLPLVFRPIVQRYVAELFKRLSRTLRMLTRAERKRVRNVAEKQPTLFDQN